MFEKISLRSFFCAIFLESIVSCPRVGAEPYRIKPMISSDTRKCRLPPWMVIFWLHIAIVFFLPGVVAGADAVFRVGSYNVENLFDLTHDTTEYPGFVPGAEYGWNQDMRAIKAENISRVLAGLHAHVIALQEVESMEAVEYLREVLRKKGLDYPWAAITEKGDTAVRCAILSMYPILESRDILVAGRKNRSILKAVVEIDGKPLVLFVNHWRSGNSPESLRILSAEALYKAVSVLPLGTDYILLGDFNANYNEFELLRDGKKGNDTGGRTGINHVLKTIAGDRLVDPGRLVQMQEKRLHYNLWMELEDSRRWSYLFSGRPRSIDNILLPAALYDDKGFSYLDNSFDKFDPHYLFKGGGIFRWQRAERGRGRHLGSGYSDHLPIYACFKTGGFTFSAKDAPCSPAPVKSSIADLYDSKTGSVRCEIENVTVIYKHGDNAVIKRQGDRAIYVYGAAADLDLGGSYHIVVNRLNRYYGNLQVTGFVRVSPAADSRDASRLLLNDPKADLSAPGLENEVVSARVGRYEDGWFYFHPERAIRVFFRKKALAPDQSGQVAIRNARIGFHRNPQIVIEKKSQIQPLH
ncbi:MAG: endonuclease/exonuclease/phosphatase family protein [Desulfosalsimonadaceae bacterium]